MSRLVSLLCLASLAVAYGCGGNSNNPSSAAPPRGEFSQTDLVGGTGATALAGSRLTVNYTGWLYDPTKPESKGQQFDSSLSAGRTPFAFTLGAGQVIRGWDQGVPGMRVGGRRRLIIPPELGYGASGSGSTIPPNASLVFDIELLNVQ
jgi:FKBP-type peptidyl-prolyl cis-trans isomerase FkpA